MHLFFLLRVLSELVLFTLLEFIRLVVFLHNVEVLDWDIFVVFKHFLPFLFDFRQLIITELSRDVSGLFDILNFIPESLHIVVSVFFVVFRNDLLPHHLVLLRVLLYNSGLVV